MPGKGLKPLQWPCSDFSCLPPAGGAVTQTLGLLRSGVGFRHDGDEDDDEDKGSLAFL